MVNNPIPVAYEDPWLVIADKPSGLLVIPTPKQEQRTLTSLLNQAYKGKLEACLLHPCHRLDRETSGLVIYAKGKAAQQKMMQLFRGRAVKKKYIAFIHGMPAARNGAIRIPLEGIPARTDYVVVRPGNEFSVVEAYPQTGRTNQLRLHFKGIGHPIVGESRFVFRKDFALKAKRLCLHAAALAFEHPVTHKPVKCSAPVPEDMQIFLERHASERIP